MHPSSGWSQKLSTVKAPHGPIGFKSEDFIGELHIPPELEEIKKPKDLKSVGRGGKIASSSSPQTQRIAGPSPWLVVASE